MNKRLSDMRSSTVEELRDEEKKLRKEIFNLSFQKTTGEIENPMRIKQVKKDIARVLTIIAEKTKNIEMPQKEGK
jgi:large subunit ribosomal protein L29